MFLLFIVAGSRCTGVAGPDKDVQAEVAAAFDPFFVLFGQHGADEPDDRGAVQENPTTSVHLSGVTF